MIHFSLLTAVSSLLLLTHSPETWEALDFDGIPRNQISYEGEQIRIAVNESATPLVRSFPTVEKVTRLVVKGTIQGSLNLNDSEIWTKKKDDAFLRVGLIEPGEKRLSKLQRLAAPEWIRRLDEIFSGTIAGVGSIRVFQVMPSQAAVGKKRTNPAADLFREEIAAAPEDGAFSFEIDLSEAPVETAGIWLLADGDDTNSSFTVTITKFELTTSD